MDIFAGSLHGLGESNGLDVNQFSISFFTNLLEKELE